MGEEFREDQAEKVQLVMRDMLDMQRTDTGDSGSRKVCVWYFWPFVPFQ